MKQQKKGNKGITLIALVITIVVLIILAIISVNAVFGEDGILEKTKESTDMHNQEKAHEKLEFALSEAQIIKYEKGLSPEELDKKIEEVGELLPKDNPTLDVQRVVVDGYIFEIDRSVPLVKDYVGPANEVIITATISGNDGWVKPGNAVTITGTVKTYSGEDITNVVATKGGIPISGFSITNGEYKISDITEDTDIVITATNRNGKTYTKNIPVVIKRDTTGPKITKFELTVTELTIKIKATAEDSESGLKNFTYTITPTAGLTSGTGIFTQEKPAEITSTEEQEYTIKITAEDNVGNKTTSEEKKVKTEKPVQKVGEMTIEEAKRIVNSSNIGQYIGTKITDYTAGGGTWRIYYYDGTEKYFGTENALYIKRDYDTSLKVEGVPNYTNKGVEIMKNLNPKWAADPNSLKYDSGRYKARSFCSPENWETFCDSSVAEYAIGTPTLELFISSYNAYRDYVGTTSTRLDCKIGTNYYGYLIGSRGEEKFDNNKSYATRGEPYGIYDIPSGSKMWMASLSDGGGILNVSYTISDWFNINNTYTGTFVYTPVAMIPVNGVN